MINANNKPQKGIDTTAPIKRVFIKAVDDEDDDSREYHVFTESSRGSKSLIGKYRRKEEAIDNARKIARKHNVRFNGEDA
ncbi:MAG: hypothetical protein WBZ29_15340 [Methanocella sp.]